jgi:hypothetical protein
MTSGAKWAIGIASALAGGGLLAAGIVAMVQASRSGATGLGLVRGRKPRKGRVLSRTLSDGMLSVVYEGELPIEDRIGLLQDLAWQSVRDPSTRMHAAKATAHCPARDDMCELKGIYDYVQNNLRYTGDLGVMQQGAGGPVEGTDTFQTAKRSFELGVVDCDDMFVAISSMAGAIGFSPLGRIISQNGDDWSHIYPLIRVPKNDPKDYVALDATIPDFFGKEAPRARKLDFVA